jgi:cytochrome P450
LHNPDDPFAKAYGMITRTTPGTKMLNILGSFLPFLWMLPFPRVFEIATAREEISKRAIKLIREKEVQTMKGRDILSLLVAEAHKEESKMSQTEMIAQIMTFLLGGHETTSTAVISHTNIANS